MVDYEKVARFLFDVLDDIDTADDMAKGNDGVYRGLVKAHQKRRFEVGTVKGDHVVFLINAKTSDA